MLQAYGDFEATPQQYEILEKLGEGAFGYVRRARDNFTGQFVAIKYISIARKERSYGRDEGGSIISKTVFRELESMRKLRYIISYTHTHSCTHILIHSYILMHSYTRTLIYLYTHILIHYIHSYTTSTQTGGNQGCT